MKIITSKRKERDGIKHIRIRLFVVESENLGKAERKRVGRAEAEIRGLDWSGKRKRSKNSIRRTRFRVEWSENIEEEKYTEKKEHQSKKI